MSTRENIRLIAIAPLKKMWGQAGFEPIIYVIGVMLTNQMTTVESTTFLTY